MDCKKSLNFPVLVAQRVFRTPWVTEARLRSVGRTPRVPRLTAPAFVCTRPALHAEHDLPKTSCSLFFENEVGHANYILDRRRRQSHNDLKRFLREVESLALKAPHSQHVIPFCILIQSNEFLLVLSDVTKSATGVIVISEDPC